MSEAFTVWTGVAVMAALAIASHILLKRTERLLDKVRENLADYRAEVRAFEERYGEGDE